MVFLILLGIVLFFVALGVNVLVAIKFEAIAFQKGYDQSIHSFAMCFWLGLIGYLYVIALPNLKCNNNNNTSSAASGNVEIKNSKEHEEEKNVNPKKEKYDKLVAKAEQYKETFYDRDYRIRTYESIIKEMELFANESFEDSVAKLEEYKTHLDLLKTKQIK